MQFNDIYFNPAHPASFGGVQRLKAATGQDPTEWLRGQETYTHHKPVRRNYKRRRYLVSGIDYLWQADLADLSALEQWNDGFKYLLVVIDVFSKFVWATPIKSKTADNVLGAFNMMLVSDDRQPENLMTDKGTEFVNERFRNFCKENDINFYTSQNPDTKAAVAERVIRTLKGRLYRYFTHKKTWKFTTVLRHIVSAYNRAKHRSIGMPPIEVNKDTEAAVRRKLYPGDAERNKPPRFQFSPGDKVKIAKEKNIFGKSYVQGWTDEIFTVHRCLDTEPVMYKLKDYDGEEITGSFYEPEMQHVSENALYSVDKVLQTRTRNGRTEYFVSWKGYPDSMNSWVENVTSRATKS